jgi:hypothetical protein
VGLGPTVAHGPGSYALDNRVKSAKT